MPTQGQGTSLKPPKLKVIYAAKKGQTPWLLQDAKAKFSALVRDAQTQGPQHITVHGRPSVVVVSADDYNRLMNTASGQDLIVAMKRAPNRALKLAPRGDKMPVRAMKL